MDKINIFKDLTVNDLRNEDCDKYSTILGDYYGQFSDFCNFVEDQCNDAPGLEDHIEGLSCSISDEGAQFDVKLDNGETKTIHFDHPRDIVNRGTSKIIFTNKPKTIEEIEKAEVEAERLEEEAAAAKASKRSKKKK